MKKILIILFLISLTGCSKNFNKINISNADTFPVAKVKGKHIVFISKTIMTHKKNFESEDCESWAVRLNYDIPLKNSIKNMLDKMLDNYTVTNKKLDSQNIDKDGYVSQISFFDFNAISNFETERNTGKYNISLNTKVRVENSSKNITNEISTNMNWEKNIFLNCNLQDGAAKTGQKALNNLMKKIYESTYESLFQITK